MGFLRPVRALAAAALATGLLLTSAAGPARADRTIMPPVAGDVSAWAPNSGWNYQDGYAQFENVNSGLCLSVDGLSTAAQTRIVQNPCYSWAANEQFAPVTIA